MTQGTLAGIASRRVLRLALGTSLCLWFSQAIGWSLSFMAPLVTMLLLSMPMPVPKLKAGILLVVALLAPVLLGGVALLPFFSYVHGVGIVLVTLALFFSFYVTARGAPPVVGVFLTLGIAVNVAIGSVNIDVLYAVVDGLAKGVICGLGFVWLAHAALPDRLGETGAAEAPAPPAKPAPAEARRLALRSLMVALPVTLAILFSAASMSYLVVMIKVATLGHQAERTDTRNMARELLLSTFWGGVGAIAGWQLLQIWPSLVFYTLIVAIAALLFGRRIFAGAGMAADASMWSYAFQTMLIVLAPAVLDSMSGSAAGAAFASRMILVSFAAIYASVAVTVFDAFFAPREGRDASPVTSG